MMLQDRMNEISQVVIKKGYKMTVQRKITVQIFLEHPNGHLSSKEVYFLAKVKYPDVGIATIYRNLDLLTKIHIIEKTNFGNRLSFFDLCNEK
ncbi:Fur family transcriptional regulator [Psychrobacillus soli]|nr:transcriptional repressor [Psychrobacillus soli]